MDKIKVLELFAGSRSIGKASEKLGCDVFSSDIEPFENINYVVNILEFDVNNVPFVPNVIWASPPCTSFSVASIGKHWNKDNTPKTENAQLGVSIVQKTLDIINHFLNINPNLIFYIENPRGKLRKLPVVENLERTTVMYCQYGDSRMKPTDIWSNNIKTILNPIGFEPKTCFNGNRNCHHEIAPRGSRSGTQGLKGAYDRSKLPEQLCSEVISKAIEKISVTNNQ
jgi:site-specific DNA-cytosine methylase